MSQQKIYNAQKRARLDAEKELNAEQAKKVAEGNARTGAIEETGGGADSYNGALSGAKKRKSGSTLAGEGESTFTAKAGKLGE